MNNVITAKFSKGVYSTTAKVFRYDVGDKLQFVGLDLPDNYRVDFSNSTMGESKTVFCDSDTVEIPSEYFIPGSTIYAWIVLSQDNGRYTKYQVNIPISSRAKPLDIEPTPAQQDALDEAIEALNNVTEDIQGEINSALDAAKASGEFDGTTIWLYDGTPVLPDYTFYKYLMRANANAVVRQFDFILLDSVLYQIISVSEFTCKAVKYKDLKGDPGQSPIVSVQHSNNNFVRITVQGEDGSTYEIDNVFNIYFSLQDNGKVLQGPGTDLLMNPLIRKIPVIGVVEMPYNMQADRSKYCFVELEYWNYPKNEAIKYNSDLWEISFMGKSTANTSIRIFYNPGDRDWTWEEFDITGLNDIQVEQVLSLIEHYTGRFLGNFATKAALDSIDWVWTESFIDDLEPLPEGSMYVSGNDYAVVQDDETQNHECWRYVYTAENRFIPQYRVNESPMTTAQLAALNSGITEALVSKLNNLKSGNNLWWTNVCPDAVGSNRIQQYSQNLHGKPDTLPAVGDLIIAPEEQVKLTPDDIIGDPTCIWSVDSIGTGEESNVLVTTLIGNIKGVDGADGNSLWTTTEEPMPASGGEAFTHLAGRSNLPPMVGDIIVRSSRYVYQVVDVLPDRTAIGYQIGDIKGEQGVSDAIWRSEVIELMYPSDYSMEISDLVGRSGAEPKVGDLVIGPEPGGMDNPTPTHLYSIRTRYNTWVLLDDVGSIKGDTGPQGPAGADYVLTAADKAEIVDDVLAALPAWNGGSY